MREKASNIWWTIWMEKRQENWQWKKIIVPMTAHCSVKNGENCMSNAFKIFRTILTGTSNFMSAQIRVRVKSDRYANAHGFFFEWGFFSSLKSMNRCRQLHFYQFLMIFFCTIALHVCRSLDMSLDFCRCIVGLCFYSFFISSCVHIFCAHFIIHQNQIFVGHCGRFHW